LGHGIDPVRRRRSRRRRRHRRRPRYVQVSLKTGRRVRVVTRRPERHREQKKKKNYLLNFLRAVVGRWAEDFHRTSVSVARTPRARQAAAANV